MVAAASRDHQRLQSVSEWARGDRAGAVSLPLLFAALTGRPNQGTQPAASLL